MRPAPPNRPEPSRRVAAELRRYLGWPTPLAVVWLIVPIVGVVLRLSLAPVEPYDYWWSMAMGKLIAWSAEIPAENLFLYTLPADAPFIDQPWLGQWALFVMMEQFGHAGPIVLRNILAMVTWVGLTAAALSRAQTPRVIGAVGLLAVAAGSPVFAVRTQIFAFIPFVILLWVIFSVADARLRPRWLLALAPLTALWANLHGTFILVPALLGLTGVALVAERWLDTRQFERTEIFHWGGATAVSAIAAMLNPRGAAIFTYVYQLTFVSKVSQTVTEWQPPDIRSAFGIMVMLTLTGAIVTLAIRRREARLFEVVLFAATAYLAVGSVRNIFWWAAVLLMVMPRHLYPVLGLKPWWNSTTTPRQGVLHAAIIFMLVIAAVLSQPGLPVHRAGVEALVGFSRQTDPGQRLLSKSTPGRIVRDMAEYGYPGRIFHGQESGGLLEYRLGTPQTPSGAPGPQPTRQVAFVDQRMELIPEAIWDDYFKVSDADEGWQEVLERYDIRTLLLISGAQSPLIRAVQADPGWALVAVDEMHLLFFRADQHADIARWRSLDGA